MKIWLAIVLVVSSAMLLYTIFKFRLTWRWLRVFSLQVIFAAAAIYAINYSGLLPGLYVPLNPTTMAMAILLGVPGVALMICIKLTLI